jgi:tRNA A37 methylthiotransferase MiaB
LAGADRRRAAAIRRSGRAGRDNRVINFPRTGTESVGDVVDVRIVRAAPHSLIGEAVGDHVPHRLPFLPPT